MDIVDAIRSAPVVDVVIFVALFASFVLGVLQGSIRRLLGIIAMVFAFLVSANLRDPLGDYLSTNWHQFDLGYNHLLAFIILFFAFAVLFSILIQGFYKRTDLYASHPIVDDIMGGLLGLLEGVVILLILVIIFNSYILPPAQSGDVEQVRTVQDLIVRQSHIAGAFRDNLAPPLVHLISGLLPSDLVAAFP